MHTFSRHAGTLDPVKVQYYGDFLNTITQIPVDNLVAFDEMAIAPKGADEAPRMRSLRGETPVATRFNSA